MKIKDIKEIEEVNEEATSPYLKPKEPSQEEQYSNLINEYKERLNKEDEEISWQERLPDILSAAHNTINYARGNPQANIKTSSVADAMKKRSESRKKDLSGLEKLQQLHQNYMGTQRTKDRDEKMDKRYKNEKSFQEDKYYDSLMRQEGQDTMTSDKFNYTKQRNLDMDKLKASEYADKKSMQNMNLKMLQNKLQNQGKMTPYQEAQLKESQLNRDQKEKLAGIKPKEMSFTEKETKKIELKEKAEIKKENRKARTEAEGVVKGIDDQIANVKRARKLLSSSKGMTDTGPLDQYAANFTDEGQALEQAMNSVSLDKMIKMFAGMSKAIDSDSERAFFQSAQPSMGKYPKVNKKILDDMIKNLDSVKKKNIDYMKSIKDSGVKSEETKYEDVADTLPEMVLMQSPDGVKARVSRKNLQKYLDKGATIIEE